MASKKIAFEVEIKNVTKVTKLKEELKKLRKQQRLIEKDTAKNTKAGRLSSKQYDKNSKAIAGKSKKLRELNKEMRTGTTATKKATKSNNGMAKQFVKGAAAIAVVIGAFRAVSRILNSVVSVFTEFEFVMAKVNAVSGATEQEFAALNETAEELGRTTFFTAAQVGELMLNFSKLGFTASEIQDAVQPTLDLATATGSDLARAALVAGAAVRGFGLDASETQRVVDVMAVSFSSSAMNIEKWQTSMTKVAPIAKAAGFSIEDTAAIMSKLTDSGIEASIAGTSFRNILLKMQDPTSELSKRFGKTIHSLDELVPAMKQFVAEGGSMADVMEVVDLRQAAAFEQMLTTADGTIELRDALLEANGEGARMAGIVGDTLQGAFLKFTSAMQGLSISVMKGFAEGMQGAVESVASFMNGLAENSQIIIASIKWLSKLVKWFGIYKLTLIAVSGLTFAYNKVLALQRLAAIRAAGGMTTLAAATMTAKRAMQALWGATGIGLVVVALSELVPWMLKTKDATEEVADITEAVTNKYHDSIKPIEQLKTTSEELIRVKGLMNDMVKDGLIVLDKEGKLLEGTATDQKVYNKYKGQAAILMRDLNTELKANDQALITEKTSIEGVATAIDILTTALTNQALVKGFERQMERITELAANAEITKQKIKAAFGDSIHLDDREGLEEWHAATKASDEYFKSVGETGSAAFEKFNRIMEEGGFKTVKQMMDSIEGADKEIEIVSKAFEKLGLDFDLLTKKVKKGGPGGDDDGITNWANKTTEALNIIKQQRIDHEISDVQFQKDIIDKKLELLGQELADKTTNEKRKLQIDSQMKDLLLQKDDIFFKEKQNTLKENLNADIQEIKNKYSVEGKLTAEGQEMILNLELIYLNAKLKLHNEYGKQIINGATEIDAKEQTIHDQRLKRFREEIGAMGGVGSAMQTLAGDNEDLSAVKEAGIAISKVATVVEAGLTLATNLQTLASQGKNMAKGAEIALDAQGIVITNTDTASKAANTGGIIANTVATAGAIIKDLIAIPLMATKAILNQGSGDPYSAFFRIIAMIGLITGVLSLFMEKGGLIPTEGKFAKGGMVRGKSHAQGGEKFAVGGRVVELEGGEAVINKRSTAMYKDQLSAMNQAGGGNKFADGGLLNMPSFAATSFNSLNSQRESTQKVIVVESDITRAQQKVNVIEAAATI